MCKRLERGTKEECYYGCPQANREMEEARNIWLLDKGGSMNDMSQVSDGYHTFAELYDFRMVYNAALFNEYGAAKKYDVHKSIRHHDGELCFGGGWFIVVAVLPGGQISNHYEMKDWDLFDIPATEKALYPFDGHSPNDVIIRLKGLYSMRVGA
jgi:hypothetical protein